MAPAPVVLRGDQLALPYADPRSLSGTDRLQQVRALARVPLMTAATLTIADFLLARIADQKSLALDMQHQAGMGRPLLELRGGGTLLKELVDPARVLAECEAKRRIVELHADGGRVAWVGDRFVNWCTADKTQWPCKSLRALAAVDADHPDYRPEWRP